MTGSQERSDVRPLQETAHTLGLNEQEVLKNVSGVLLTVPIGDYENPFNALNGKIFGWEIFAQFKFVAKIRPKGGKLPPKS